MSPDTTYDVAAVLASLASDSGDSQPISSQPNSSQPNGSQPNSLASLSQLSVRAQALEEQDSVLSQRGVVGDSHSGESGGAGDTGDDDDDADADESVHMSQTTWHQDDDDDDEIQQERT